jgi:pyruvate/2-oxoglutarate dehydrogenase complex dihydrolipoamide dehydrogenase (E3) component
VILAAGSVPRTIPGFDIDGKIVVTSDEFLDLCSARARDGDRRWRDRL